jgi:hypothetical protein
LGRQLLCGRCGSSNCSILSFVIPGRREASSPESITTAISREKELKKWRRDWKIRLIEENNPGWVNLYPGISS